LTRNRVVANIPVIHTFGATVNARADDALPDEPAVEYDDTWGEADWAEILAELPEDDDIESEPHAFSTGDYPTHEEGMAALWKWMCTLGNGDSNEIDTAGPDPKGA
jgi:hypothetical protein